MVGAEVKYEPGFCKHHSIRSAAAKQLNNYLTALILTVISPFANALEECAYFAKESSQYKISEWELYDNCAQYKNEKLIIAPKHREKIDYDSFGLASFLTQGQFFCVKKDGSFIPVISFDNGADYFREGLTRSLVNGKIAYYNQYVNLVIPPKYDWGWPFSNGRALVCSGCSIQQPDESGHKAVTGGFWGYINKEGKEFIPVKYSHSEIRSK